MRILVFTAAIGLAAAAGAHPAQRAKPAASRASEAHGPPALPVFSFMGENTETPSNRSTLNASACTTSLALTECNDYSRPQLAGTSLKWLSLSYNHGLLYQVMGGAPTNSYVTLLEAFSEKYGRPKIETSKWQAKSGATFDNSIAKWEFKSGELRLESFGPDLNTSLFTFDSTANSPPLDKPKVDF